MNSHREISRNVFMGVLITICFIVTATLLPFLALPVRILTPLPILFCRYKFGRQQGMIILLITILTTAIIFGGVTPILLSVISFMMIGFVIGELFEKNLTIEATVLIPSGAVLLSTVVCLFYYSANTQISILSLISRYIDGNISAFLYVCKESGISNRATTLLVQQREHIINFAVLIMPSSAVITLTIITWLNVVTAKPLMLRKNISYPDFGHLNHWRTPENLIWGLIIFGLILIIGNKALWFLGLNGLLIVFLAYFFQGIAITSFYLSKKRLPTLARIVIYSLIGINQIFLISIICIGIFDVWFNFRKIEAIRSDSHQ